MNKISFKSEYDIVVGGAGVAGISAAVAASRAGANVALIEKSLFPGGLATSGLVNIFLPLCDGNGTQIIYGIAEELLKLSIKYGTGSIPPGWSGNKHKKISRYMLKFSPAAFVLGLDEYLEENNIDIWYDTSISGAEMDKNRIREIEVNNKSGKGLIKAECFIDATGDADIANFADCKLAEGENNMTIWAIQASIERAGTAVKFEDREMLYDRISIGADESGKGHPEAEKTWKGINGRNVTEYTLKSRKYLREYFKTQISKKGDKAPFPLALPAMSQFRKTRRIVGIDTIRSSDANRSIENSIGEIPDWRKKGIIWQIPEGALIPEKTEGLLVAGRIISAEDDAWEAFRAIPAAALTGELAGKMAVAKINSYTNSL